MKRYKIVGCPKCQRIQTIESDSVLRCKVCGRSTRLKSTKTGDYIVKIFGSYDNPSIAAEVCTRFKGKVESNGKLKYEGDEDWTRK